MLDFQVAVIPVTLFQQNCSLMWHRDTRLAVIVDPGGEPGRILEQVSRVGVEVEAILLTHGHLDHAGGALALKGELDRARSERGLGPVPLLGPDERDLFLLEGIEAAQTSFGLSGLRNVVPDRFLTDGEVVEAAGLRFDVLHVPGHSPGHVVYVEASLRFAFVGDTVFRGSVGRTDFPYGDGPRLIEGIRARLLPLGDDMSFICGHGPGSTFGVERATNPFLRG